MIASEILIMLMVSLIASFLAIKVIKPIAFRVGLVDKPTARKRHKGDIPLIGGLCVFVGVLTAISFSQQHSQILNLYLIASASIVFVGILDDYYDLSVRARLVAQVLISSLMVFGADVYLSNLGNILAFGEIELSWFGYPLTVLAVIASINAFNMTDGIDGLAGSLSLITFLSLGLLMSQNSDIFSILPIILCASIIPFLGFNLAQQPSRVKKIFMGDAGSMYIGFSAVWLLIEGSQGEGASFRPVTALWIIAIPFWDMAAITIRRVLQGRSPFKPDREHLHHLFLRMGLTSFQALVIISSVSLLLATFGIVGEIYKLPESLMFGSYLIGFCCYFYSLKHIWKLSKFVRRNFTHSRTRDIYEK